MSSKDELFDEATHRSVQALELKLQQYRQSGKRGAYPYIEPGGRSVDVPLATTRQRIQAWIDNSPYEDEKFCRIAYQEAFEAELAANDQR